MHLPAPLLQAAAYLHRMEGVVVVLMEGLGSRLGSFNYLGNIPAFSPGPCANSGTVSEEHRNPQFRQDRQEQHYYYHEASIRLSID